MAPTSPHEALHVYSNGESATHTATKNNSFRSRNSVQLPLRRDLPHNLGKPTDPTPTATPSSQIATSSTSSPG
ncbi:hypothetical protein RYX36_022971 [Vicia faba]